MVRTGKLKQAISQNVQILPQAIRLVETKKTIEEISQSSNMKIETNGNVNPSILKFIKEFSQNIHFSNEKKAVLSSLNMESVIQPSSSTDSIEKVVEIFVDTPVQPCSYANNTENVHFLNEEKASVTSVATEMILFFNYNVSLEDNFEHGNNSVCPTSIVTLENNVIEQLALL